jgi:hypothetical protein
LLRIQTNEERTLAAYERSCKPKRIAHASKSDGLQGTTTVSSATQIERDEGDPRLLAIIQRYTDQRIKLLGLGGQPTEEKKKESVKTFSDYVYMHLMEREQTGNGTKPRAKPLAEISRLRGGQ